MYLDEGEADGARAVFLCDSPLGPRPLSQGHVQESVGPAVGNSWLPSRLYMAPFLCGRGNLQTVSQCCSATS